MVLMASTKLCGGTFLISAKTFRSSRSRFPGIYYASHIYVPKYVTNNIGGRRRPLYTFAIFPNYATSWNRFVKSTLTGSAKAALDTNANHKRKFWNWKYLALLVKFTRIPFLVMSVFYMGHQQGMMDYARDPHTQKKNILHSILQSVIPYKKKLEDHKVISLPQGELSSYISSSSSSSCNDTKRLHKVATVATKVIVAAKTFVDSELQTYKTEKGPTQFFDNEEEIKDAKMRICGEWMFYLIDTPLTNAFVTEALPQHIFITTSMLSEYIENEDELALILGHEISHLILGHLSQMNRAGAVLKTLEVVLLSLDPTEGFISILLTASLGILRKAFSANFSRDNESQADFLGTKLAAMACYDTRRGANVFRKMALSEQGGSKDTAEGGVTGFLDSHPPTLQRHQTVVTLASTEENASKYDQCRKARGFFHQLWNQTRKT